jgi:hypothetical protein
MILRFTLLAAACVLSAGAHAQQFEVMPPQEGYDIQRESGIYTTKPQQPQAQPQMQRIPMGSPAQPIQPAQPGIQQGLPKHIPFGRASSDAMIPIPDGPRTTSSAPVPGVDIIDATEATPGDIVANELPEAVVNPTKATAQTGSIFEDKDVTPHPVQLRALNKVTGHATLMTLQPGEQEIFGNLTIKAHVCRMAVENTQPDSAALIEVDEKKPDDERANLLFSGWMFASSPSLTGLEHPIYDISVVGCKKGKNTAKNSEKADPSS